MDENRNFKGVWIPKEIWCAADLGWSAKLLLVEIDSLSNNGECFATNEYFAGFFGLSKDRISKVISELNNKGYISVKLEYNGSSIKQMKRTIQTTIGYRRKQLDPLGENADTPIGENADHNNSKIINTSNKDDDDSSSIISSVFDSFRDQVTQEQFDAIIVKIMKRKGDKQVHDLFKYLFKGVTTELTNQQTATTSETTPRPRRSASKGRAPKLTVVKSNSGTESVPSAEDMEEILRRARELKARVQNQV